MSAGPAWAQLSTVEAQGDLQSQSELRSLDDVQLSAKITEALEISASDVATDFSTFGRLLFWNRVAIDASGVDHTPVEPGEDRVFGEQVGPARAARAMAIVHIASFEAVNAVVGGHRSLLNIRRAPSNTSLKAAIAQATHDTLVVLYPSQKRRIDRILAEDLSRQSNGQAKTRGIELGKRTAAAILAQRANDGSAHAEPVYNVDHIPSDQPGHWRQDPISREPLVIGARWNEVTPFVVASASQFRTPAPPALTSAAYTTAFNEVKRLGGDGVTTPTQRTRDQTIAGIFWAYDGTPSLCAPPRLYNQVAVQVGLQRSLDLVEMSRLLAIMNVSMADAALTAWESKFFWDMWRPILGIRESDPGTGPTGLGDGNPNTVGDVTFSPLGAPASNLRGPDFTPPFPSYPSGHATLGGSLFQTLRRFFGTDNVPFVFLSDEWNGRTRDNDGTVRPFLPRFYPNFSRAEEENGQSRIYLGIHYAFDKNEGIASGRKVANLVFDRVYQPVGGGHSAEDLQNALSIE